MSAVPQAFGLVVYGSALFVGAGAATYLAWYFLWHEHEHVHASGAPPQHAHTTQQRQQQLLLLL